MTRPGTILAASALVLALFAGSLVQSYGGG